MSVDHADDIKGSKYAETRDRAGDLQIFSLTLSQLSYRGHAAVAMDNATNIHAPRCIIDWHDWAGQSSWSFTTAGDNAPDAGCGTEETNDVCDWLKTGGVMPQYKP